MSPPHATLAGLRDGESAVLSGFDSALPESWQRRFSDLGMVPGTRIERIARAPLGDPLAFLVRGTVLCLRRSQARHIRVRRTAP
jgi:ferrous iron transport protein A